MLVVISFLSSQTFIILLSQLSYSPRDVFTLIDHDVFYTHMSLYARDDIYKYHIFCFACVMKSGLFSSLCWDGSVIYVSPSSKFWTVSDCEGYKPANRGYKLVVW